MVQFYPWFKFYSILFQTYYHTLSYPKTKENKIQTKDKIVAQNIYNKKVEFGSTFNFHSWPFVHYLYFIRVCKIYVHMQKFTL